MSRASKSDHIENRRIVAFYNQKGGVGKTNAVIRTAQGLADRGKRVLVIDCDYQCDASKFFIEMQPDGAVLKSPIPHHSDGKSIYTVECLFNGDDWDVYPTKCSENIFVLPSRSTVDDINKRPDAESSIRNFLAALDLPELWDMFDVVVIDMHPEKSVIAKAIINAATDLFIPCQMEKLPFEGLLTAVQTIEQESGMDNRIPARIGGLIPTMYKERKTQKLILEMCKRSPILRGFLAEEATISDRVIYNDLTLAPVGTPYRIKDNKKNESAYLESEAFIDFIEKKLW